MNKLKLFVENFLVYGFGGIISKVIPLIMVPIVTRLMPSTEYFGISDLSSTLTQFSSTLAIMGMYDAMYRMFFEKDERTYKKTVCSTALIFTAANSLFIFLLMLLFRRTLSNFFFKDPQYLNLVYLSAVATLVGATNSIVSAPTRMQNQRKVFLIANTVSPLLSYSISIPLLISGHYIIALPLAGIIAGVTMEACFGILNRSWFSFRLFDRALLKQLLVLAIPLLPNVIIFWVFHTCDRLMITSMIGVGAEGVYSVGSKLGHASQLIYTAFAGGWQYFAFSTMKEKNQVETNSRIYEYLGIISFFATAFICAVSFEFFRILFPGEYLSGYVIAPYLFLAPLLQMLYQTGNSQFIVIKKTWPGMFILSCGAIVNVLLNLVLIPVMGMEGAAVATLLGYVTACVVDIIVLIRCRLMRPSLRFLYAALGMGAFLLVWRLAFSQSLLIGLAAAILYSLWMVYLYQGEIRSLAGAVKGYASGRKHNTG